MSNVSNWSTTAASNNSAAPNGAPEGMSPAGINDTIRENMAAAAKVYQDQKGSLVTAGSGTAYTLTTNNSHSQVSYIPLTICRIHTASTGAATLSVDGLPAKALNIKGSAVTADDLPADVLMAFAYNSSSDSFDVLSVTKDLIVGTDVQAHSAVLDATTASFTTAHQTKIESTAIQNTTAAYTTALDTKLSGIETAADVTDATNVAAAGAAMKTDTSTTGMAFVVDEDGLNSNLDTKVPTQQSVKAYVDNTVTSIGALSVAGTPVSGALASFSSASQIGSGAVSSAVFNSGSITYGGTLISATGAEINHLSGVTSNVQNQINNISVTSGSLTKTFALNESATISLNQNVTAPVVGVTKEVPQIGVTTNAWNVDATAQNYTRQDVAVSTTLNFVPDIVNIDTGTAETWNISNYGTSNVGGICFSADGLVAAFVELTLHSITFGNFTTAYDFASLASADSGNDLRIGGTSPSAVSYGENPTGVKFGNNDTKMYVSCRGPTDDTRGVAQYSITFDVNSGTHTFTWDGFFSTGEASPPGHEPTDVAFNSDGTKMYVLDNSGTNGVLIYDLTTPWDITGTVTYNSQYSNAYPFAVPHNEYGPSGMCFSADGSYVWFLGIDTDRIYQLNLSTPYDLTTNTGGTGLSFAVSYVSNESTGVFVSPDNSRLFFTDQQNNRTRQLTLPVLAEKGEEPVNFSLAYTSYSQALDVTSDSSGVVRGLSFNDDGTKVYFVGDNTSIYQWNLTSAFDLSTATSSGNTFNVGSQEGGPQDVCFNNDGTKMFVTGTNADDLVEYALSSAYDITTATFTTQSTGTIGTNPKGIAFNNDGTILFAVGGSDLYAWSLGTGFDTTTLNTSAFLANNNYNSLGLIDMTGIQFSSDGLRMLISCTSTNTVYEFSLSTAFDITTASGTTTSQLNVGGQSSNVSAVRFNNDMSKLYISGGGAVEACLSTT